MKKFSLKDFVNYNSPCFSCGQLINLELISKDNQTFVHLKPVINQHYTTITLHIGWGKNLTLAIDHRTNKFATNDMIAFKTYLTINQLFLRCKCGNCQSYCDSEYFEFQLDQGIVRAVSISEEALVFHDQESTYYVDSFYPEEKTVISITEKETPYKGFTLTTPLMPRWKFKNKEQLLNKIRLYATFS
jgi:hypothetical protein